MPFLMIVNIGTAVEKIVLISLLTVGYTRVSQNLHSLVGVMKCPPLLTDLLLSARLAGRLHSGLGSRHGPSGQPAESHPMS